MGEHKSDFINRPEKIALHNSFAKYGYENHKKNILAKGMSKDYAYKLEERVVRSMNTNNSKIGLNSRSGGLGGNMIDFKSKKGKDAILKSRQTRLKNYYNEWNAYEPIIHELKDTHTIEQIAKEIGKGSTALCKFLKRKGIKIPIKRKFDLQKIALEIEPYVKGGLTNSEIMNITKYSNGTLCRAKNKLEQIREDK